MILHVVKNQVKNTKSPTHKRNWFSHHHTLSYWVSVALVKHDQLWLMTLVECGFSKITLICIHTTIKKSAHWGLDRMHFADNIFNLISLYEMGWVGLWGFLWWVPSAKRKNHHGVSSGWSSVWHCSNTDLSSSQYEQISIILGVWPFCLTPFFFRSITFWRA